MQLELIRAFFGWCTIINGGLVLFSFLVCSLAGDWAYRMHSKWFPISREAFTQTIYCFIGAMKLIVLMFNLVPYLALVIVG